ncbi:metallophosphoesterase [Pseudonocardia sp. KRD-184]|uniref:Metallophosphoesterase n=1 Tax=Pseudonocardia oceani TaxID=2792013 RepID=A0ABS6U3J5_9PSEU|nr:metallophosphoesterase [Pseudonocardia oceani]MBW0092003.1 metallophosphoesterase [Pseudonocardia oceani]MBW0099602.1 metallophosphoesterase [Pseudonocardia oceani]MBW0112339.1 metallophosphoesterase [Pseudonocardia oceani]MBW0123953.1 metallophosphoesterase [Pseudonocardia oceani]MBW0126790.1 metallophosphoesterase [Pseudonocardia oceani]
MKLWAVSDLHVRHPDNRAIAEDIRPESADDWLIVAGDVAEQVDDVVRTLAVLRRRFARVVWVPGNHELWTRTKDPVPLRGVARYERLVAECRALGVDTPEDPFPVWTGPGGPVVVAPLFLLFDYSFLPEGATTSAEGLAIAYAAGVVCTDEHLLHPDPFPSREAWCAARVEESRRRLDALDPAVATVLVNHWPLTRLPTRVLRHPEFALWCGTTATADWHVRYRAQAVVYGHLHIPRVTVEDGVSFREVSLGYPREWRARAERRGHDDPLPRQVLPAPAILPDPGTTTTSPPTPPAR